MNSAEIRQRFLNYFAERDHKLLPSSSLIPFGDPTLLFTSAGMVPFKPYFLGQTTSPYPRVTTVQKCFRTVDIEVVGHDGHHLTLLEMLGNFSFGDYFKEKAIPYAWELLTDVLRIPKARLWAGIHNEDDVSFEIWTTRTDLPAERIRRFGDDYNFWAAGPTGPCGFDSEIHYDWGIEYSCGRPDCGPNCEHCDRFLELWNLVFMEWDRDDSGRRTPLQRKGIDTGMGLERLTSVLTQHRSVFDTDLLRPLIQHWEEAGGKAYGKAPEVDISLRVLADHGRGSTLLLADGVVPSNEGRGYVLRRLIRRGMVHARRLGTDEGLSSAVPVLSEILGGVYPEVQSQVQRIRDVLHAEEERFAIALRTGLERLNALLDRGTLSPEDAFYLHDTMGFPLELTAELARERGVTLDMDTVATLMQAQRDKSRAATTFAIPMARQATRFVGYDRLDTQSTVLEVFPVDGEPGQAYVFLDVTPFYAERGGQQADQGWLQWDGQRARVLDVQPQAEASAHRVAVDPKRLHEGQRVHAEVDRERRTGLATHHSATHLLHKALREVLGEEAKQAGSLVTPDYATFDFRFPRALIADEVQRVFKLLNAKIRADLERRVEELSLDQAMSTGAVALFDEKYGDPVRVVSFGDWARELCGGTHVERSGQVGLAMIGAERSIGAGVRRIELRAGAAAEAQVRLYEETLSRLSDILKGGVAELPGRVETLQSEVKRLQREVAQLRQRLASGAGSQAAETAHVDGVAVALQRVDADEKDLLVYADHALSSPEGPGVAVVVGGRRLAVKVAPALAARLEAAGVVRAFTAVAGGKGGGRGPVGEGGGIDPARVPEAFQAVQAWIGERLKESS